MLQFIFMLTDDISLLFSMPDSYRQGGAMGRKDTKAIKSITKMYEQLELAQDDIFHKTKLLLSIYRDVVWSTLSSCDCVNEEIYYYGDDLNDALVYLEEFAPDIERSEFESRVCSLFENKWMMKKLNIGIKKALGLWVDKPYRKPSDIRCLCVKCLEDYKSSPNYIVKRLDPFARVKEKCDKCEGYGYDYLVIERSKEGR